MGFTKLDDGLLQSSICGEDAETFKIWIILLAACREDGIARISPVFLSSVSKIPIDSVMKCIEKLCSPDPYSRSKEKEGRRMEPCEGGYYLINYKKYRAYTLSDAPDAIRQRRKRERDMALHVTEGRDISASVSSSVSASEEEIPKGRFRRPTFEEVRDYCLERKNGIDPQAFLDHYEANGWKIGGKSPMKSWQAAIRTWERRRHQDAPPRLLDRLSAQAPGQFSSTTGKPFKVSYEPPRSDEIMTPEERAEAQRITREMAEKLRLNLSV